MNSTRLISTLFKPRQKATALYATQAEALQHKVFCRLMKYLVPEDDLRLEVHFLVSLFICILGLLTTVNGKTTYAATEEALNWKAIILSIGLFVVLFLIGFAWNKLKWPLLQRKELKKRSKINQ